MRAGIVVGITLRFRWIRPSHFFKIPVVTPVEKPVIHLLRTVSHRLCIASYVVAIKF